MITKTPTPEQLTEITRPKLLAVLSTVNLDGSPQATPVWYLYDGEFFKVSCHSGRLKARNVRRNPSVTLTVLDTANNGTPLLVKGTAEIVEDGGDELTHTMARRYDDEAPAREEADGLIAYAASVGERRVIIRITPGKVTYGH